MKQLRLSCLFIVAGSISAAYGSWLYVNANASNPVPPDTTWSTAAPTQEP